MRERGLMVIDLFCGAGGFSEGFHQAGFDVVLGIDNWRPACETHELNGLGRTRNLNLLEVDVDGVLAIKRELEDKQGGIDVVIGSPPCTEFSYAKKGGKGNIEKGMLLVRKHLLFVTLFKPRYWLMENVPRLEEVLNREGVGSRETGWTVPYEKLGIPRERFQELGLEGDSLFVPNGTLLNASEFGTCENRKRFIAGKYPLQLVETLKVKEGTDVSLGSLIKRLMASMNNVSETSLVEDPNYPRHMIERSKVRDYDYDTSLHMMYWEEMRHLKRRHIQYGRMHLPEDMTVPARTVMATFNSSSRESLIFDTGLKAYYQGREREVFRQPNVREVACIQGFPLDFQLVSPTLSDRYKLVGNAVPCQLSYALAKAISMDVSKDVEAQSRNELAKRARNTQKRQKENDGRPILSIPEKIVPEAKDIGRVHSEFKASPSKRIRRKILSSKLESDSCVVIFENSELRGVKVIGGPAWKACIQRGGGKSYSQVFLDEVSVRTAILALSESLNTYEVKDFLKDLLSGLKEGVPLVDDDWAEFLGYDNLNRNKISNGRIKYRRLPGVDQFQRMFTEDTGDIYDVIGPVDLFDGLDYLMLSILIDHGFKDLEKRMVRIGILNDNGNYPFRNDPRIVPYIRDADVPLITIIAGLLSVHVLRRMYELEPGPRGESYLTSLREADDMLTKWCGL